eukprot:CAMPEP_0116879316 /NCGR_PEP_ID=MMETSP0463-20121206/11122_1 /TAXON_ID=181622 /ORGANISM="Strombidinopsis sp, Strain SopsisLIS2011" /LENGTH=33 /DNA_ID= /DNA_START= /DNA_END= /DNA_ORIENTATION=
MENELMHDILEEQGKSSKEVLMEDLDKFVEETN